MFKNKLKEASRTMIAGGVDPKYVKRTAQELQDHYDDLKSNLIRNGAQEADAAREAEDKIGNLHDIAIEATNKKELKSWISMHPRTTFLGGPLLAVILVLIAWTAVLYMVLTGMGLEEKVAPYPDSIVAFINTMVFFLMYMAPCLLAALFVYLSKDRLIPTKLMVFSIFAVALLSSLISVQAIFPQNAGEMGQIVANINFLGFMPRIPGEVFPFIIEPALIGKTLLRIALAVGVAFMTWRHFKKKNWLSEPQNI